MTRWTGPADRFVGVDQIARRCRVSVDAALTVAEREHVVIYQTGGAPVVAFADADRLAREICRAAEPQPPASSPDP